MGEYRKSGMMCDVGQYKSVVCRAAGVMCDVRQYKSAVYSAAGVMCDVGQYKSVVCSAEQVALRCHGHGAPTKVLQARQGEVFSRENYLNCWN